MSQTADPAQRYPGKRPKQRRSRGKRILLWALGVVVVLALGFGALVAFVIHDDVKQADAAQPGKCLDLTDITGATEPAVVDCAAPTANYLVAARVAVNGKCPPGDYLQYTHTARFGGNFTLCLAYDWKAGDCFSDNSKSNTTTAARIACTAGSGPNRYKVSSVLAGVTDSNKCPNGFSASYTQPAETICFQNL